MQDNISEQSPIEKPIEIHFLLAQPPDNLGFQVSIAAPSKKFSDIFANCVIKKKPLTGCFYPDRSIVFIGNQVYHKEIDEAVQKDNDALITYVEHHNSLIVKLNEKHRPDMMENVRSFLLDSLSLNPGMGKLTIKFFYEELVPGSGKVNYIIEQGTLEDFQNGIQIKEVLG